MKILLLALIPLFVCAKKSERFYQEMFMSEYGGTMEVLLQDGTRCDIITKTHAIEVDFANKWAEAIGQSLNYARQTNKKAGILLLIKSGGDQKNISRLVNTIQEYELPIEIFYLKY